MNETKTRSLIKGISWRIIAIIMTLAICFMFTGNLLSSIGITSVGAVSSFGAYYIHERIWTKVSWGYGK